MNSREMTGMEKYASKELDLIIKEMMESEEDKEDIEAQIKLNKQVFDIVSLFSQQGHSGSTADYTLYLLSRLLNYEPLSPLTGKDDEWLDVEGSKIPLQQNKRCPYIFRENNSNYEAFNSRGKVFSSDGGETWHLTKDSYTRVIFPYVVPEEPERILLEVEENE